MKNKLNLKPLKFVFSLFISFLSPYFIFSQSQHANFNIGFETGGTVIIPSERAAGTYPNFWSIRTAPFINFRLGKGTFVGLNYEDQRGALDGEPIPILRGVGVHARQYFNFFKSKSIKDRLQVYGELAYFRLNYLKNENAEFGIERLPDFSNYNFQFIAGMNVRLFHSFYINYGLRPMTFSKGKAFVFSHRVAFEYHFGEKRPPMPKATKATETKYTNKIRPFDFTYFLREATIGTSFTYIFNRQDNLPHYKEKVWNFNMATSLSNDLDFGLAYLLVRVQEANLETRKHHLVGGFLQYDFVREFKGNRAFFEVGLYQGDLCTCGDKNPYYAPRLNYISYGAGGDIKISKQIPLFLDLSFLWYRVMNKKIEDRWAMTQYVIGLNFRFY